MEFIKQSLNTNKIDISDIEELGRIFEMLGNQQESKKIFAVINKYLTDLGSDFSIWQFQNRSRNPVMVWFKGEKDKKETICRKDDILKEYKNVKRPIFEEKKTGIYSIIPVISKEEVIGFFCLHDEIPINEEWKKLYLVVSLLSFVFKYYDMIEMVREMSIIDLVTGLHNFKHFSLLLGLEVGKARRFKKPLSLVTIKIKDFDIINEKLGFEGGEEVLKEFARILKSLVRMSDVPSRINDEIFALSLYETSKEGAEGFISRLRKYLNEKKINVKGYDFNLEIEYLVTEYHKDMSVEQFLMEGKKI